MANDFLNDILDQVNGTVAHVSQLRQSLGDLEIALIKIRHRCENELLVRAAAAASHDGKIGYSPSPSLHVSRISEGSRSVVNSGKSYEVLPSQFGTMPVQLQEAPVPARNDAKMPPMHTQVPLQRPPQPPTQLSPFPEHIDLSSCPPELKHEGDDWFVVYNLSPKVKRVLDLNLVHTIMHDSVVACVEFSQDGKWLATGCRRTAQIYDTNTGIQTCLLDHENDTYVESVSFSPDGKYLASASGSDEQIRIWDIANKQIHDILKGHQNSIHSLRFSPNGQFIVSGSHDGTVRIWDIRNRTFKVIIIDGHYHLSLDYNNTVWSVTISPDGRYVAIGTMTVAGIWEITTGLLVRTLRGHTNGVGSIAFTPDGKGLISGSWDATLKYWDVSQLGIDSGASTSASSTSPCLMNFCAHKDYVYSTAVSHDGMWLVSGSADRNVLFCDMRTGVIQCMLSGHRLAVGGIGLSPVGDLLATASEDQRVRIWSYASRLD